MEFQDQTAPSHQQDDEQARIQHDKPSNSRESPRAAKTPKRGRTTSGSTAISDWANAEIKSKFPDGSLISKAVDVIVSPAVVGGSSSEISLRFEKSYKVRVERTPGQTRFTGELHLVPWDKYKDVVDGFIAAVASFLGLRPEQLVREADIPAMENGTAYPAFRLTIPRAISDDEQRALGVVYSAFTQRMRGQDESLTKDLFTEANPAAVIAGQTAAEGVRRKAGGRSLPHPLTVTSPGSNAKPIKLAGRIGAHPDPERDEAEAPMSGKVVSIRTEERQFQIRSFEFKDKTGKQVKSAKGKKFMINYSDKEHRTAVLGLPLGLNELVDLTVIPRVGRNRDKLMLKSIGKVQPPTAPAAQSSTTP